MLVIAEDGFGKPRRTCGATSRRGKGEPAVGRSRSRRELPHHGAQALAQVAIGRVAGPSNIDVVDERSRRIARRFELPMIIAALLVIPVIVLEESPVGEPWDTVTAVLNWAIWSRFSPRGW
jgi:hypothetical protein